MKKTLILLTAITAITLNLIASDCPTAVNFSLYPWTQETVKERSQLLQDMYLCALSYLEKQAAVMDKFSEYLDILQLNNEGVYSDPYAIMLTTDLLLKDLEASEDFQTLFNLEGTNPMTFEFKDVQIPSNSITIDCPFIALGVLVASMDGWIKEGKDTVSQKALDVILGNLKPFQEGNKTLQEEIKQKINNSERTLEYLSDRNLPLYFNDKQPAYLQANHRA